MLGKWVLASNEGRVGAVDPGRMMRRVRTEARGRGVGAGGNDRGHQLRGPWGRKTGEGELCI